MTKAALCSFDLDLLFDLVFGLDLVTSFILKLPLILRFRNPKCMHCDGGGTKRRALNIFEFLQTVKFSNLPKQSRLIFFVIKSASQFAVIYIKSLCKVLSMDGAQGWSCLLDGITEFK